MRVRCGTDIIEIERIKQCIDDENTGEAFKERVYTKNEISYCEGKRMQKYQHYAARFAAKEATFKAISEQIDDKYDISWTDIEILNDRNGRPFLNVVGIKLDDIENIDLSLSHCKEYAVANVTVLLKEGTDK